MSHASSRRRALRGAVVWPILLAGLMAGGLAAAVRWLWVAGVLVELYNQHQQRAADAEASRIARIVASETDVAHLLAETVAALHQRGVNPADIRRVVDAMTPADRQVDVRVAGAPELSVGTAGAWRPLRVVPAAHTQDVTGIRRAGPPVEVGWNAGVPSMRVTVASGVVMVRRSWATQPMLNASWRPGRAVHPSRRELLWATVGDSAWVLADQAAADRVAIPLAMRLADAPLAVRAQDPAGAAQMQGARFFGDPESIALTARAIGDGLVLTLHRRESEILAAPPERMQRRVDTAIVGCTTGSLVALIMAVVRLTRLRRREAVVEAQEAFLATVSHELRTPIAEIRAFSEVLKRHGAGDATTGRRAVDGIEHAAQHLGLLVENVLRLGRPPATGEHPVISRVTTDVTAELQATLEAFRPIAERRAVEIDTDVPDGARVRVPPFALRQIVLNLLDNAVKYGPPGQRVRIVVVPSATAVRLSVQDEGPGIAAAHREHVWRPFKRGPGSEAATGSGLGLAVVRAIAEDYGGAAAFADAPCGLHVDVMLPGDPT